MVKMESLYLGILRLQCGLDIFPKIPFTMVDHESGTRPINVAESELSTVHLIERLEMNPIHAGLYLSLSSAFLELPFSIPYLLKSSAIAAINLRFSFDTRSAMSLLRSVSACPLAICHGDTSLGQSRIHGLSSSGSMSSLSLWPRRIRNKALVVCASEETNALVPGVIFQPFEEIKKEEFLVPMSPQLSLSRQYFSDECEDAINEQINVEYAASYIYHALFAYFDRDNIALKGLAKFFRESSEEEREHAEKLMKYQNIRGGRVKLHTILLPPSEFEHPEKGDALYAMELALSIEKLTNMKLLSLHSVAERSNDKQMADFIESEFLTEQVEDIKKIAEYVSQLRMVGKGHGVWHFDQMLLHEGDAA